MGDHLGIGGEEIKDKVIDSMALLLPSGGSATGSRLVDSVVVENLTEYDPVEHRGENVGPDHHPVTTSLLDRGEHPGQTTDKLQCDRDRRQLAGA